MYITVSVFRDADAADCPLSEIKKRLRQWAVAHASRVSDFQFPRQKVLEINLDFQSTDHLSAIQSLRERLDELQINFIVTYKSSIY